MSDIPNWAQSLEKIDKRNRLFRKLEPVAIGVALIALGIIGWNGYMLMTGH